MVDAKQSVKRKTVLVFFGGALTVLLLMAAYHVFMLTATYRVKISCHTPFIAQEEYCVYHTTTPTFRGEKYTVSIGTSPGDGLSYDIPYKSSDVMVGWSEANDNLTVALPFTTLVVEPIEYTGGRR